MNYRQHTFDIDHLIISNRRDNNDPRYNITDVAMPFAKGHKVKVKTDSTSRKMFACTKPKNTIDYLKMFLVKLVPSLSFGWLQPEVENVYLSVTTDIAETYYNIYPTKGEIPPNRRHFEVVEFEPMSPSDFLLSEPFTHFN